VNAHASVTPSLAVAAPPLGQVYFYLTQGCNCRCRHCWVEPRFDPKAALGTLPVETFAAVIREAMPLGLRGVKLTGGEPLLHPRILDILGIVRREGPRLTAETNGMLCTPEVAAAIARIPDSHVSVSLDGVDPGTVDRIRGVRGAYSGAIAGIGRLVDAGIRPQLIMSLLRSNVGQAEEFLSLAQRLGAASVKFNIVQPIARGGRLHQDGDTPGIRELIELGRSLEEKQKSEAWPRIIFDIPPAFISLRQLTEDGTVPCGIRGIIGVLPTGEYALCGIGELIPELVFGAAGKQALADIWLRNESLASIRKGLPGRLQGVCGRCLLKGRCLGKCIAQNYYRSRSLFAPHWFCERAEEEGLFPQTRLR